MGLLEHIASFRQPGLQPQQPMRPRHPILWLGAILVILTAVIIFVLKRPVHTTLSPQAEAVFTAPPQAEEGVKKEHYSPDSPPPQQATNTASSPITPVQTKAQRMREGLAALNDEDVLL